MNALGRGDRRALLRYALARVVWGVVGSALGWAGMQECAVGATLREVLPSLPGTNNSTGKTTFEGERSFTDAQLRETQAEPLGEIDRDGVTPARGDDLAFYIGSYYRKAGFSQASVEYRIEGSRLRILIREGPRTLLRKVGFTGNRAIPDSELYQYMIGATPEQLLRAPEKFPYTAAEVLAGADRIRGLYLSRGYLKAEVNAEAARLSADGTRAEVNVRIEEGATLDGGRNPLRRRRSL